MKRWSIIIAGLLLLVLHDPASAVIKKIPLSIIYPGEGMGRVRLGNSIETVKHNLGWGAPDREQPNRTNTEYALFYNSQRVVFVFTITKANGKITKSELKKIIISSPSYTVAEIGIQVGDSSKELNQRNASRYLGQCRTVGGEYVCSSRGISFKINPQRQTIERISIIEPGRP